MRVLHLTKTLDGGHWAAWQAAELVRLGVEVHVAIPATSGLYSEEWKRSGAQLHLCELDFPATRPWELGRTCARVRKLIDMVRPGLVHSHFVGTTLSLRKALGKHHDVPRVFQLPGPLHLEHRLFRALELSSAGPNDYWIASSQYTQTLLKKSGVTAAKVYLSYYGWHLESYSAERTGAFRSHLGIPADRLMVGNISWLYPPKWHLGHVVGLKCHEELIAALGMVLKQRPDAVGVLAGGQFGGGNWYEERLRKLARQVAGDRILMPGRMFPKIAGTSWPDFDCAIHAPLSENCGGVLEPLYAGVPTVAARVGGVPEVVIDGVTGKVVEPRNPNQLASGVLEVLEDLPAYRAMAFRGRRLLSKMFDVRRTAAEVYQIYRHILDPVRAARPAEFSSLTHAATEKGSTALYTHA